MYGFAASGWQVIFDKEEAQMKPMNLSEAHFKGYTFNVTDSRMVFRTAYGQPHSLSSVVNEGFKMCHCIISESKVLLEALCRLLVSRWRWSVLRCCPDKAGLFFSLTLLRPVQCVSISLKCFITYCWLGLTL